MSRKFLSLNRIIALALVALTVTVGSVTLGTTSTVRADATPHAMEDMGNCVEFLGIGNEGDSCVNIVHASPDAPAVDIYVDGQKALEGLAFGTASGWIALPAGEHQVKVAATGGDPMSAVIDAKVMLEAGAAYEVAAVGLLANIAPAINQVNLSDSMMDGARIRVVHASPDAPAVDIAVKGGDVLVPGLAFPVASDYLEVPAGTYDLEVRPAGTTDVALELPGVELAAGTVYSVYAIGLLADGSLTVLPIVASQPAEATPEA